MKKLTIFNETTSSTFLIPQDTEVICTDKGQFDLVSVDKCIGTITNDFSFVIEDIDEQPEELNIKYSADGLGVRIKVEKEPCIIHNTDKQGNCLKCGENINNELKELIENQDKTPVIRFYCDEPPYGDCSTKKTGCRSIGCQFGMDRKKKPPIGLMPQRLHVQNRMQEINESLDGMEFKHLENALEFLSSAGADDSMIEMYKAGFKDAHTYKTTN